MIRPNPHTEPVVRERFDAIAASYDDTIGKRRDVYNQAVDAIVFEDVSCLPAPVILDAGCGTATRPASLKRRLPLAHVYGFDASPNMVSIARDRGLDEVRVCRIEEADYPDRTFDVVTCLFFVICYITSPADRHRAVANLHRMLKPGGLLFIDAINRWHLGEGLAFRRSILEATWDYTRSLVDPRLNPGDKLYSTVNDGRTLPGYFHGFSKRSFARLLDGAGFLIERRHIIGYNSGLSRPRPVQGQLLYVCRRAREG
jgi:SAM-dependent methyltransferase